MDMETGPVSPYSQSGLPAANKENNDRKVNIGPSTTDGRVQVVVQPQQAVAGGFIGARKEPEEEIVLDCGEFYIYKDPSACCFPFSCGVRSDFG